MAYGYNNNLEKKYLTIGERKILVQNGSQYLRSGGVVYYKNPVAIETFVNEEIAGTGSYIGFNIGNIKISRNMYTDDTINTIDKMIYDVGAINNTQLHIYITLSIIKSHNYYEAILAPFFSTPDKISNGYVTSVELNINWSAFDTGTNITYSDQTRAYCCGMSSGKINNNSEYTFENVYFFTFANYLYDYEYLNINSTVLNFAYSADLISSVNEKNWLGKDTEEMFISAGYYAEPSNRINEVLKKYIGNLEQYTEPSTPTTPNAGQEHSEPTPSTAPKGNNDNTSDSIGLENNNNNIAIVGNLLNMYKIDSANLRHLNSFLWSTDFLDILSKYVNGDPFKCIVSLMSLPFDVNAPTQFNISLLGQDTGAIGGYIVNTIATIDCGSISVPAYWGNFIDYNTQISIYLPYIGSQNLDIQDVMNSTISLVYKVDLLTGACVANIKISKGVLNSYIYQYSGNMGIEYPLSSADRSRLISGIIGSVSQMALSPSYAGAVNSVTNLASANAPQVNRSGNYNGNSGILAPQTPFLYIQRPVQSKAQYLGELNGEVSNITVTLSTLSGYAEVDAIHLEVDCYAEEYDEIIQLLENGVIF